MNSHEKRVLQEFERFLERADPEFARTIRTAGNAAARRLKRIATAGMVAGGVLAVIGLHLGSEFGGIGILIALAAWALRVAAPTLVEP